MPDLPNANSASPDSVWLNEAGGGGVAARVLAQAWWRRRQAGGGGERGQQRCGRSIHSIFPLACLKRPPAAVSKSPVPSIAPDDDAVPPSASPISPAERLPTRRGRVRHRSDRHVALAIAHHTHPPRPGHAADRILAQPRKCAQQHTHAQAEALAQPRQRHAARLGSQCGQHCVSFGGRGRCHAEWRRLLPRRRAASPVPGSISTPVCARVRHGSTAPPARWSPGSTPRGSRAGCRIRPAGNPPRVARCRRVCRFEIDTVARVHAQHRDVVGMPNSTRRSPDTPR